MTIADMRAWGKQFLGHIPPGAAVLLVLIISSSISFGLGIFAGRDIGQGGIAPAAPQAAARDTLPAAVEASVPGASTKGNYVASKNGTKYYLPTCSGVARISEANKIWFATKEEAEAHGLAPAATCPGL